MYYIVQNFSLGTYQKPLQILVQGSETGSIFGPNPGTGIDLVKYFFHWELCKKLSIFVTKNDNEGTEGVFFGKKKSRQKNESFKNFRDFTGIPVSARNSNPGIENLLGSRSRPDADPSD